MLIFLKNEKIRKSEKAVYLSKMYLKKPENYQSKPNKKGLAFKVILFVILILLGYGVFQIFSKDKDISPEKQQENNQNNQESEEKNSKEKVVTYTISEGDIPAEVFSDQGKFDSNDVELLLTEAKDVYDFSQIKSGQTLRFYFNEEEKAVRMEYDCNKEEVVIAERKGNAFECREEKIAYDISTEIVDGKIENFFYVDAQGLGLSDATILEIADIFSFDIDFTTEIQTGDSFKIIYEKRTRSGEKAPDGKVLAAKFTNSGQEYAAYYFETKDDGSHYDSEGHELMRQFLRAPLSYRYISSGFTGARYHPITKTIMAHYQIDYAAPSGTPVVSTARGTVVSAGWEGGWGKMVRLRHDNGYTTHYGHLSDIGKGIRSGVSVAQGQIVGYVGSTGWSTGPHLDYGMKLNGSPVNPLSLKLPKGTPLAGEQMEKFQEIKRKYDELLR